MKTKKLNKKKYKRFRCDGASKPSFIYMSENDRILYIFAGENDDPDSMTKVVNVAYQILVDNKWITILRYDSSHGFLHRHMRKSVENKNDIISTAGVKKIGHQHALMTWAIEVTKDNYLDYKTGFLRRSGLLDRKS